MSGLESSSRLRDNPFYVLGLAPECTRAEVERAGQKLLAMLELGLAGARDYPTPFGPGQRDPAKVREAMAELRDPQRRLFHELWAGAGPQAPAPALALTDRLDSSDLDPDADPGSELGFSAALPALGWR